MSGETDELSRALTNGAGAQLEAYERILQVIREGSHEEVFGTVLSLLGTGAVTLQEFLPNMIEMEHLRDTGDEAAGRFAEIGLAVMAEVFDRLSATLTAASERLTNDLK